MNTVTFNGFQFNDDFDSQFLTGMYEDLAQLDEIFTAIIAQLKEEYALIDQSFEIKDKESVRKIFHKIKPLWGYVGLTKMQNYTQLFETSCGQKEKIEDIEVEYFAIRKKSADALECLTEELERIKLFI